MNKKIVGIVAAAIVAVVVIVAAVFMMGKKEPPAIDSPDDLAKSMHKNDPSKTIEEWKDIGNQELTEEQKQVAEEVFSDPVPEIDEIISVDEEKNEITFKDVNGDEWIMEADPEIANMTDEEARAYTQQILDSLGNDDEDDSRVDFGNNSVNFPSNTQGNPNENESVDQDGQVIENNHGQSNQTETDENNIIYETNGGPTVIDPWAGMTPEEKAAQQEADRKHTEQIINETQGTMQ